MAGKCLLFVLFYTPLVTAVVLFPPVSGYAFCQGRKLEHELSNCRVVRVLNLRRFDSEPQVLSTLWEQKLRASIISQSKIHTWMLIHLTLRHADLFRVIAEDANNIKTAYVTLLAVV